MKQTAVEWLVNKLNSDFENNDFLITYTNEIEQSKEKEKQQQDKFAIEFADWYEEEILAKGDYNMIAKDKKELLEIFKNK